MSDARILGDKYELLEQIGKGGMGTVYEAVHLDVGRRFAVKTLSSDVAERPEARARFEREARAAGRIEHANVCEVTDFGVDEDGQPFYVMPLLRGRTLTALIREEAPLAVERSIDIVAQVLAGLEAAHELGIVHRDLKPDNVFLTELGDRQDFVKLLDFGITKLLFVESDEVETPLTDDGAAIGTPHYMAPEQARGVSDLDSRADLFAVGAILYRLLTGERHVAGGTASEILWNLWNEPITPARSLRPELSPALDAVLTKAMAQDRRQRFESAAAMREALLAALEQSGGEEGTAPTLTPVELPSPAAVAAPPASPTSEKEEREPETRPRRRWPFALVALALLLLAAAGYGLTTGLGAAGPEARAGVDAGLGDDGAEQPAALSRGIAPRLTANDGGATDGGPAALAASVDGGVAGEQESEAGARREAGVTAAASELAAQEHERGEGRRRPPRAGGDRGRRRLPEAESAGERGLEAVRAFGEMP